MINIYRRSAKRTYALIRTNSSWSLSNK